MQEVNTILEKLYAKNKEYADQVYDLEQINQISLQDRGKRRFFYYKVDGKSTRNNNSDGGTLEIHTTDEVFYKQE